MRTAWLEYTPFLPVGKSWGGKKPLDLLLLNQILANKKFLLGNYHHPRNDAFPNWEFPFKIAMMSANFF